MTFIGQCHEICAILEPGRDWAEARIRAFFSGLAEAQKATLSPVRFHDGVDQDLGPVLIGEVAVIGFISEPVALTDDLDSGSLARLRTVTRNSYRKHNPSAPRLTDAACDQIINEIGPGTVVEEVLRQAVNSRTVH